MDLRNIFKKKKKPEEKHETKKVREVEVKEKIVVPKRERKTVISEVHQILKSPHVTEKASDLAGRNKYVFKVGLGTNKIEIKKAIQSIYGVDVLDVRTIKIPRKQRRLGRQKGWRKCYKKAIVKIKEGQKIEVLPR